MSVIIYVFAVVVLMGQVEGRLDLSSGFEPQEPSFSYCVGAECNSGNSESDDEALGDEAVQTEVPGFRCPSNETSFHKDATDCHRYYICFEGVPTLQTCQAETAYLPEAELCVSERFVKSCHVIRCRRDGIRGDPMDCSKYYNCFFGHPYHLRCANGTLFDPVARQCSSTVPCLTQKPHDHDILNLIGI